MEVSVIPLTDASNPTAGATFAGGLRTQEIELSAATNTLVFNLIPSYNAGLTAPILYRVMWRAGVMGRTYTYDFAMPDADLTFDALQAGVSQIIGGETYLQQTDLGIPGRVARLNNLGQVIDASGTPVAGSADITAVENDLAVEINDREAAVANLNANIQSQLASQINATLQTTETYTDNKVTGLNADLASERGSRINSDTSLQAQITTNLTTQNTTNTTVAGQISSINAILPTKASLDNTGYVPINQIPPSILTNAVPVPNQAGMLALSSSVVHKGDLALRPDGTFLLVADDPSQLTNWVNLSVIFSVNGKRGDVVLSAADVGAIPTGGAIAQTQVTGLSTTLSAKANTADLATAQTQIAAIQNDPTLVHTVNGVVPTTVMSTDLVFLNQSGQLVHKDGTIIPLGQAGSGSVFSINGRTGIVVLTAADVNAIPAGSSIAQSQVTGLSTTLTNKADLDGSSLVPVAQVPSLSMAKITGLSTALNNKADLTGGLIPLAQVPSLPQSQVTGLTGLVSGNQLTSTSNAINRIATLEAQVAGGGGGGGGGAVSSVVPFYTSPNTTSPVYLPNGNDFTGQINLHSPWGIDSDGTITGTTGTWYYLYAGVRSTDVAFPYITMNGHLQLHKWNETGPADPVYALQSDVAALTTTVGTKANATDLATTNATVATKANASDLTTLSARVDTKANTADLNALATSVALKANQSDLNTTNQAMAQLATTASVTALSNTVATKANQTDMVTAQNNITTINATLPTKADLTAGVLATAQIPNVPQAKVVNLTTTLAAKADLDGTGRLTAGQLPTAIPQSNVTGLGTALGAKADLVGGVVPLSQIPLGALPNVVTVANRAALLALTAAQVQYGDLALITGTTDMGTYVLTDLGNDPSLFSHWTLISSTNAPVTSVNTRTGDVVLSAADVGAMAANASIPQSQITGLTALLGTYATTTTLNNGLAGKTGFTDVQNMLTASSFVKRADYVANTPIASLSGSQSVDGVLMPQGAIVLATAQSSSVNNGLWVVSTGGTWVRPADYATGSYLARDTIVISSNTTASASGTTNPNTIWQMAGPSGFIDTSASTWVRIGWTNPPFVPTAGNGIAIAGSTFSAVATTGRGLVNTSAGLQTDPNVTPSKFVATLPSGSTVVGVTHNLNTTTPVVSIWDTQSSTLVLAGITVTSVNSISIEFNTAPASGQYRVCVLG